MQRKFLAALLLFAAVFTASMAWAADVEINEQNFPDPEFRRYVRENLDDGNGKAEESGDNKLSASEINSVMTITLDYWSGYRGIKSLSGINYFTNLQNLDCSNQALTSLTLSLPSLQSLKCYGNQLTTLNVSGCTSGYFNTLYCQSNQLTGTLDLSALNISTLDCSDNPDLYVMLPTRANDRNGIRSLKCNNVDGVGPLDSTTLGAYLRTLECRNANLTTLDLSGKATYVTEIDVSENPNLTSITWDSTAQGQVFASINSINISGTQVGVQSTINTLSERSGNPTYFYANNMGNMITLDISAFTNLKFLYLQGNHLTSLTLPDSMNSSYLYIYLESNDFTSIPRLPENTTELHIANNKITSTGTLLNVSQDLRELDVSYNSLTAANLAALTKLEKLNLSHNSLTADTLTLPAVIDYTSWNSPDLKLDISYNNLASLPAMPAENISTLDVSGNGLTALDLSGFILLEVLYAGENQLKALDTTANSKLYTLWVDYNSGMDTLTLSNDLSALNISGTSIPMSAVPVTLGRFYADSMDYALVSVDLTSFDALYILHMSNNGEGLKEILITDWEPYKSREIYIFNNSLTNSHVPGGTAWLKINDNHLVSLDVSACIDDKGESWLEEADVDGQTSTAAITKSDSSYLLDFASVVGSSAVSHVQDISGKDSNGSGISVTYSNGIAAFSAQPATVSYNFNAGVKLWGESYDLLMPVILTVSLDSSGESKDVPGGDPTETPPVLSSNSFTLSADEGLVSSLSITAIGKNISWSMSGTLPAGMTFSGDGNTATISGTPSAGSAGSYSVTVTATNSGGSASATAAITVAGAAPASKDVKPEVSPDVKPVVSPDIHHDTSPDVTPDVPATETTAEEVISMTDEELAEKFSGTESLALSGNVDNLNDVLDRIEQVTVIRNLDLSAVEGLENVNLSEHSAIETVNLAGNSSVKTVELNGSDNLSEFNAEGSAVESVDVSSNKNLSTLNVKNCVNLKTLKCAGCSLSGANLEGCVNLEEADLSGNSFTKFDADVFTKMRELECAGQSASFAGASSSMNIGAILYGESVQVSAAEYGVYASVSPSERVVNLKAYSASGQELTVIYDKATGAITFNGTPARLTYEYVTGFEDVNMDVTVAMSGGGTEPEITYTIGNPGGGCDSGIGGVYLLLSVILIFGKYAKARKY